MGGAIDVAAFRRTLAADPQGYESTIDLIAEASTPPAGVAKSKPAEASVLAPVAREIPQRYRDGGYASIYEWADSQGPDALAFATTQLDETSDMDSEDFGPYGPAIRLDEFGPTADAMLAAFTSENQLELPTDALDIIHAYQGSSFLPMNVAAWGAANSTTGKFSKARAEEIVNKAIRERAKAMRSAGNNTPFVTLVNQIHASTDMQAEIAKIKMDFDATLKASKALDKMRAPFSFTVTRSQGQDHPLYAAMQNLNVGEIFVNRGIESTSLDSGSLWGGAAVRIDYRIPKGMGGAYLNGLKGYEGGAPEEQEWLIPAGIKWTVVSKVIDASGKLRVTMEPLIE